MASIYDVNAAIDKPNLLGTALAGLRVGNEQRALREQRADAATLRGLAPAVMAGEAGALEQAAAIDPAQAAKFQAVGDIQAQKFRNWFTYTDNALQAARKTGNLASVNAALQAGGNFISQMTGKPAPTQWTPDMDAGWEQLRAKVATLGAPANPDVKVVGNALVDTTGRELYRADIPVNGQIINVPDGQGGQVQMIFDPRTRELRMPQYPGAQPQVQQGGGMPVVFDDPENIPAPVRQALLAAGGDGPTLGQPIQPGLGYTPPKTGAQWQPLTPDEVAAVGLPPGTVAQRNTETGQVQTIRLPSNAATSGGKPLPQGTVDKLTKDATKLANLTELAGGFADGYAGNKVGGSFENLAGRLGGEAFGLATPGQAAWWQQYDRYKNEVRNELFGASLTAGEQAAFEAADITPNMTPAVIRQNMAKQAQVIQSALQRKANTWAAQGYNREAIEAATGLTPGGAAPAAAPGRPALPPGFSWED